MQRWAGEDEANRSWQKLRREVDGTGTMERSANKQLRATTPLPACSVVQIASWLEIEPTRRIWPSSRLESMSRYSNIGSQFFTYTIPLIYARTAICKVSTDHS